VTAAVVVVVAVVISTPINVVLWGGTTGVVFGDAIFTALREAGVGLWLASFCDEAIIDLMDKFLTIIITFFIMKALPKSITSVYETQDTIEAL
jgi:energy-coupling factor transport system substrate-specific component